MIKYILTRIYYYVNITYINQIESPYFGLFKLYLQYDALFYERLCINNININIIFECFYLSKSYHGLNNFRIQMWGRESSESKMSTRIG